MVYCNIETILFPSRLTYSKLDDLIINGDDVEFLKKIEQTIDLQKVIAERLNVKIITPPKPYSMFNLDEIIMAINFNFLEIEKKINDIEANNREDYINFDEFKKIDLFFNEYGKNITININSDSVSIETSSKKFKLNIEDETMEIES